MRPTYSMLVKFYIADTVLASISAHAAESCPGIRSVSRVIVHATEEGIRLQLDLTLDVRENLFQRMMVVQQQVRQWIELTTSLTVAEVTVNGRHVLLSQATQAGGQE